MSGSCKTRLFKKNRRDRDRAFLFFMLLCAAQSLLMPQASAQSLQAPQQYMRPPARPNPPTPAVGKSGGSIYPIDPEKYCRSRGCRQSLPAHRAMLKEDFQVMYEQDPVCKIIQTALNSRRPNDASARSSLFFPRTNYKVVDLEGLFQSKIFLRWNPIHYWYDNPDLFHFARYSAPEFRPDAWLAANFLNDGNMKLVVSGIQSWTNFQKFYDVDPLLHDNAYWSDPRHFFGLPELTLPNEETCGPTWRTQIIPSREQDSPHTSSEPTCDKPLLSKEQLRKKRALYDTILIVNSLAYARQDSGLQEWTTPLFRYYDLPEFASVNGNSYELELYTDFVRMYMGLPDTILHLTTGIIINVRKYSRERYTDLCLLAVGTGITSLAARSK